MQSGYELSMLDLVLQFGSEDLVRELVSIGVPVLQPENILPKSSLSLTTKVAIAILDASASPMLLNSFRICWSHPDGMWERCVGCGCCHGEVQADFLASKLVYVRSLFY